MQKISFEEYCSKITSFVYYEGLVGDPVSISLKGFMTLCQKNPTPLLFHFSPNVNHKL